ncbi:MAG: tripartite tricarboxylate transporter TctB family protein [Mycobacterium sp.]
MTTLTTRPKPRGLVLLEWSAAAVSLIGGLVVALFGWTYGLTNVTGVGAGFFPCAAGALMAVAGVLWLAQLGLARRTEAHAVADTFEGAAERFEADDELDEDAEEAEFPDRAGWIRVGIIVAAIFCAALVLPVIGYTLTMTLMLATVLFFVSKRPWWLALIIGVGAAVASRLVFEGWLGTELPASSIEIIAGLGL